MAKLCMVLLGLVAFSIPANAAPRTLVGEGFTLSATARAARATTYVFKHAGDRLRGQIFIVGYPQRFSVIAAVRPSGRFLGRIRWGGGEVGTISGDIRDRSMTGNARIAVPRAPVGRLEVEAACNCRKPQRPSWAGRYEVDTDPRAKGLPSIQLASISLRRTAASALDAYEYRVSLYTSAGPIVGVSGRFRMRSGFNGSTPVLRGVMGRVYPGLAYRFRIERRQADGVSYFTSTLTYRYGAELRTLYGSMAE